MHYGYSNMSRVIIHLGHGKTGSSYLQASLASFADTLLSNGICYPTHTSFEAAKNFDVTSGNGELLFDKNHKIPDCYGAVLYSNEILFESLLIHDNLELLIERAEVCGSSLEFFLYTRDFIDHSISSWHQYIKRGRGVLTYDQFVVSDFYSSYLQLYNWIEICENKGLKLTVLNYSKIKQGLFANFLNHLFPSLFNSFTDPLDSDIRVNRSLTASESELQRLFNVHYSGESSWFVSDPLIRSLPNIPIQKTFVDPVTYNKILEKWQSVIETINQCINPEEAISLELHNNSSQDEQLDFSFSKDQLSCLVISFTSALNEFISKSGMSDADSNLLKFVSDNILRGASIPINAGYELIRMLHFSRPNDSDVLRILREFEALMRLSDS